MGGKGTPSCHHQRRGHWLWSACPATKMPRPVGKAPPRAFRDRGTPSRSRPARTARAARRCYVRREPLSFRVLDAHVSFAAARCLPNALAEQKANHVRLRILRLRNNRQSLVSFSVREAAGAPASHATCLVKQLGHEAVSVAAVSRVGGKEAASLIESDRGWIDMGLYSRAAVLSGELLCGL